MRITQRAEELVKERARKYGDPKFNFDRIAKLWSVYLKREIGVRDVTLLFILAKIARDIHLAQPDNIDDIIGYIVAFDRATNPTDYHESLDPIFPELECGPTKTQVPVTEYDCKPKQEFRPISKEMPLRWWNKLNIDEVDSVVDEFNGRR